MEVLVIDENKDSYHVKYVDDHVKVDSAASYYEPGLTSHDQVLMATDYHHCTVVQYSFDGKTWHAYGSRSYK